MRVKTSAYVTVKVKAPDQATAFEYVSQNGDFYGLDWEIDEYDCELEASMTPDGEIIGVSEVPNFRGSTDYEVDREWLEENGYEVVMIVRKRETQAA